MKISKQTIEKKLKLTIMTDAISRAENKIIKSFILQQNS